MIKLKIAITIAALTVAVGSVGVAVTEGRADNRSSDSVTHVRGMTDDGGAACDV